MVYRRTRKDEDYTNYKKAVYAATNDIRQYKSKQNVRDRVGPLEDSAGNIISQGFLMAEDLNGYFSSVFTREDINSR